MTGKWHTTDNETGKRSLKQHFYIEIERRSIMGNYIGNKALCNKGGIADENHKFIPVDEIEGENMVQDACRKCQKIFNNKQIKL